MEGTVSNTIINTSNAADVKGNSVPDVKAQEILGIGTPPIARELQKSPVEKSITEGSIFMHVNDQSKAVTVDANVSAKQLVGLEGFPE